MKSKFGFVLVISLIVLSIVIFFRSPNDGPQVTVEEQLNAIKKQQLTEAYYAYTSKEFQAATALEDFKRFLKSFPLLSGNYTKSLETIDDPKNETKTIKGVLKNDDNSIITAHYQLIKQANDWKILNMKFITGLPENEQEEELIKTIVNPVKNFLDLLREGDIKQAYKLLTSTEFKEATTFVSFENFLESFPVFLTLNEYDFLETTADKNRSTVKAKLINGEMKSFVDFSLTYENSNWLIRGIQVEDLENLPNAIPDFNEEDLRLPIVQQLKNIDDNHMEKAYKDFSSEAFRQATSFEQFQEFINQYPAFKNHSKIQFLKLGFNNNIGTYYTQINSKNGTPLRIEYALIKENGKWKILQIQIFDDK